MDSTNKGRPIVRKIDFQGLEISVETDKGQYRHWHDPDSGEDGKTLMKYPYGYFCGLKDKGADGDQLDVFVGPNTDSDQVYVIHQMKKPDFNTYDEDKVMIGFESPKEAVAAYQEHFDDPKFLGSMEVLAIEDFKRQYVKKSLSPMMPNAQMAMMMTPPDDPDLPEGVEHLLSTISSMNDEKLREIGVKVWGPGYQFQQLLPNQLREELIGFLLDQKEMFMAALGSMQSPPGTPGLPPTLASSQGSTNGQLPVASQSNEENSSGAI